MRFLFVFSLLLILTCILFTACHHSKTSGGNKAVEIKRQNGRYVLYRNNKPFLIKGGAGYTRLRQLYEAGGNTIRVWDTLHLAAILDSAQANHLAVVVGIYYPLTKNMDEFYNSDAKVSAAFKKITGTINKYKHHPAILCWCLGNEITFPLKPSFNKFYTAFNNVVDMIHRDDPNHPVTTTVMNFNRKNVLTISLRTNIDFIYFNIFGSIHSLAKDLSRFKTFWSGPFLIAEWGIEGPWIANRQNAWAANLESTSTAKATDYLTVYQKFMPVNDPGYLGEMVFYWGQKEEVTPTWFSLFDKNGAKTEAVNTMQFIWTGRQATSHAPGLKYMLLNDKSGADNVFLSPDDVAKAQVFLAETDKGLTYKWQLIAEDWFRPAGIANEKDPVFINNAIIEDKGAAIKFKAPAKEGPYRLLAYVYNQKGYVATCNTPFYVLPKP